MRTRRDRLRRALASDLGATATEYVILVGFLAFLLVVGAVALAAGLNGAYEEMGDLIGLWPTP